MANPAHDDDINQFCELTSSSAEQATEYLEAVGWDVNAAVASFFADQEEAEAPAAARDTPTAAAAAAAPPEYTGPRTLDGRPAPQYASSASSASKKPQKKKGLATLRSLGGHDHDDEDDHDDDEDEGRGPRDLFAGGEKSGLAVQDPSMGGPPSARKVIKDIIAKAKANASRPDSESAEAGPSRSSHFRGTARTLGGEGVESRTIPDPRAEPAGAPRQAAAASPSEPPTERVLHLWQDGFSVDDGPLHRFDDPANAMDLQMIRQGRAPLHLMNVRLGQAVDVKLQQHEEDWHQLPRVYRPFGGEGRRLGSPVPGESITPAPPAAAAPARAQASSTSSTQAPAVDDSQPTITIRIQLPDGTRLPARFNATHTIGDVYEFVQRASPATQTRGWVLATTFPNKDHDDRSLTLGDVPEFRRGGTAVVKWT